MILMTSISTYSQKYLYECNCEENEFRQTFEIDTIKQTIRHYLSLNLSDGERYKGDNYPYDTVVWTDNQAFSLIERNVHSSVYFYHWNFQTNKFILRTYSDSFGLFLQEYKCFWIKNTGY